MTERLKKAVDKYIECGDKKEALAFGEYQVCICLIDQRSKPT